jgi:phospholipid/cholesterol/gamma-HCH transport system substrate-binding protein
MKQKVSHYFWVGLFTLGIGGLALVLMVIMAGKQSDHVSYHSFYKNVSGISFGTPVYYEGYRVGQVESINPEFNAQQVSFKVTYSVLKGWQIPVDSNAQINAAGLLSDMSININGGDAKDFFQPDDTIPGKPPADLFSQLGETSDKVSELADEKVAPMLDMLHERLDNITEQVETALPDILSNVTHASEELSTVLKNAKQIVGTQNQARIETTLTNLSELTAQVQNSVKTLDQGLNNINGLVTDARDLLTGQDSDMAQILAAARYVMHNFSNRFTVLMNDIESAGRNLNEATNEIRKDPSKLIFSGKSEIQDDEL